MQMKTRLMSAGLALLWLAAPGYGAPAIRHDPVQVAAKGQPLGIRATVHDAAARIESASLYYAASRGTTPFRVALASSGAGTWYGTIPGHMVGPGPQLLYYLAAENADGETQETDWYTVRLVDSGVAPEAIPSASDVARQAQRQAVPAAAPAPAAAPPEKAGRNRYLVPAAIIAGGAVAVGGAFAIAESSSGGGGGSTTVSNANFGGSYNFCFEPTSASNTTTVCDSGLVNVYVRDGGVEIVGLWAAEIFTTVLNGNVFSVSRPVAATVRFPESQLILSGEIRGDTCTVNLNGYSRDPANPGDYNGLLTTTKR